MQRDFQGATPVIVDVGSHTMKIGFAGRNGPRAIFPVRPYFPFVLIFEDDGRYTEGGPNNGCIAQESLHWRFGSSRKRYFYFDISSHLLRLSYSQPAYSTGGCYRLGTI